MTEAIFLSAGVPDDKRAPHYAKTSDPVAISSAISALLYVTLGRRQIVFGGQPGITPMVWSVAEGLGVDYAAWVTLYQSMEFEDVFPEETAKFGNVVFTKKGANRAESLKDMRYRMFSDVSYSAAVFIGGMKGLVEEFQLFSKLQPDAAIVPVYSTGGAVLDLADLGAPDDDVLREDLDYLRLLADRLGIGPREPRYKTPDEQPRDPTARVWKRPKDGDVFGSRPNDRFRRIRLTPEGCRAGRALLKWSTRDLARRAGVPLIMVNRIEAGHLPRAAAEAAILAAFASAGVAILRGPEGVEAVLALDL